MRRAAFISALSVATDLAIGQPLGFALKSCVLAVRLTRELGGNDGLRREVYHQALLRYIGCNADTYLMSALFGDEIAFRREFALIDMGQDREVLGVVLQAMRRVSEGQGIPALMLSMLKGLTRARSVSAPVLAGHCEVAGRIVERLGFDTAIISNVGQLYERWDGKGLPNHLKGEAVAEAVRIVTLAQDVIVLGEHFGPGRTLEIIKKRRGGAYEPRLVDTLVEAAEKLLAIYAENVSVADVLALEPAPHYSFDDTAIDEACLAAADFADMRLPFTIGHSRAVAKLSEAAARRLSLPDRDIAALRRAALVHDLGELSIPASVLMQGSNFSAHDEELVRLHPYYTERILTLANVLPEVAAIASQHHERLDGSGYHRGLGGAGVSMASRILAAAEFYQTLIEQRPHRPALSAKDAAARLKQAALKGQFDTDAAAAVLGATDHKWAAAPTRRTEALTPREVEVLRGLARGETAKQIARQFGLSPKTVDNHIQNLYAKIGVSTRGAAVLFAVEQGYLQMR